MAKLNYLSLTASNEFKLSNLRDKMSKTKTILAARKGMVSDEPLRFEYSSLIDIFELFNLVGGGTERDTADLLLNSPDFLRINCYFFKSESELRQELEIIPESKEVLDEFLNFMFENAKDINNYFNGIHNGSKTFERIKIELDDYAITFSRIFMKIEDVLSTTTASSLGINETLFIVQMNTLLYANKKMMIVRAEKEAHVDMANEIIENMHKKIGSLEEEINKANNSGANLTLKTELDKAKSRIIELENEIKLHKLEFNEKDEYSYPPELDLANQIWKKIYIEKDYPEKFTSHNNRFEHIIKKLGLDLNNPTQAKRIRVVTTPKINKEAKK